MREPHLLSFSASAEEVAEWLVENPVIKTRADFENWLPKYLKKSQIDVTRSVRAFSRSFVRSHPLFR